MDILFRDDFNQIKQYIPEKEALFNSTWLITGCTGMIGSYFLSFLSWLNEEILENSVRIVCLTRSNIRGDHPNIGYLLNKSYIEFRTIDLSKEFTLKDIRKVNYVFHGASNAAPATYLIDPIGTINSNVRGTQTLLDALKDIECLKAFLYVSSGEIYGEPEIYPTPETYKGITDNLGIRSCYVEAKRFAETLCWNYYNHYGVPIKLIRPVHVYGPGFRKDDSRVWADFITKAIAGKDIEILGDGKARRGFCYISDAITQIFAVIQRGVIGEVYNIGSSQDVSIKELANMVKKLTHGDIKVLIKNKLPVHLHGSPQVSCPSITKVNALASLPKTTLEEGIQKSIEWYEATYDLTL